MYLVKKINISLYYSLFSDNIHFLCKKGPIFKVFLNTLLYQLVYRDNDK